MNRTPPSPLPDGPGSPDSRRRSGSPPDRSREPRTVDVGELMQGEREIQLQLDDAIYRLRVTRFGRLILTK